MSGVTINPAIQTNAAGTFSINSTGYFAGVMLDDPAKRFELRSGIVSASAAAPMWGGEAVTVSLTTAATNAPSGSAAGQADELQAVLTLATAQANVNGFTVFNQSAAMLSTPQSPVPLAPQGGSINYALLGSGARITVPISASNAATLRAGSAINTAVYWDYTNQVLLIAPGGTALPVTLDDVIVGNCPIVSYSSGTGFATYNYNGSVAVIRI